LISPRLKNLIWIFVEKFGLIVVSFITFLIFAAYLSAQEYGEGIFAIAVVEFVGVFLSGLWNDPLVRQNKRVLAAYSSIFWFGGATACLTVLLVLGLLYLVNSDISLLILVAIASLKVLAVVLARPFVAQMRRERNFKKLAMRTLGGKLLGALIGIVMAMSGFGSLAVIMQIVVMETASLLVMMWGNSKYLAASTDFKLFINMTVEGFPIAIRQVVSGSLIRGTIVILGFTTSSQTVGYFGFANRLVELPYAAINTGLRSYVLPVFASRANQGLDISTLITRLTVATASLLMPIFLWVAVLAPFMLSMLFADKWSSATEIFQVIAILAACRFLTLYHGIALISLGKAKVGMVYEIANALVTLMLVLGLSFTFGLTGVLVALTINLGLDFVIKIVSLKVVLNYALRDYLINMGKMLLALVCMFGALLLCQQLNVNPYVRMVIAVCVSALVYLVVLRLLRFDIKHNIVSALKL